MFLTLIFSVLLFSIFCIFFLKNTNINLIRIFSLFGSGVALILSCMLMVEFDPNSYHFQSIATYKVSSDFLNIFFTFGLDGISLFFLF